MPHLARAGPLRHPGRRRQPGVLGLALVCVLVLGCIPDETAPPTGQALYVRHCASCHGVSGKGDGPVAGSLQQPPADLTAIARLTDKRLNASDLMEIIDGRRTVAAHGPREMPVWGEIFSAELEGQRRAEYVALLHVRTLTDYIWSIQEE